ncbi:MAG: nucleotide exchange factor GrpE [Candidatus Dojkabacteria bacterium]
MESLTEKIKHIISEAEKIRIENLSNYKLTIDYVNIFSSNSEEYDFYSEEALKIGNLLKEVYNGIYVMFNQPLDVSGFKVRTVKVRKPDPSKTTDGALDFVTSDYEILKGQIQTTDRFELSVNTFKQEEIVVTEENTDAYIAISSIPILETLQTRLFNNSDLEAQIEEERQKRLQLMSDFQNYQRRIESEKALFGAMANMGLLKEMLEVFDDLNLALSDNDLNLEHAKSSMKSAQDKLVSAIQAAGVERINVSVGDEFNKDFMEAVSTVPTDDESQKGKIIAVISSAFKYKDKEGVLKPARVVVGK